MLFDITYMWNQKKKKTDTNEIIYKTEMDSQTENKPMVTKVQRVGRSTGHLDRERDSVCVCMCVCVWSLRMNWEKGIHLFIHEKVTIKPDGAF